jgi:hypothetical protein
MSRLTHFLDNRLTDDGEVVSPIPGRFLVLISVRRWVNTKAIVRLKRLCQLKNPMTSSGIEPMSSLIQDNEFSTNLQCTDSIHFLFCFLVHPNVKMVMVMVTGKKFTLVTVTIPTECYAKPPYKDWTATWSSIMVSFPFHWSLSRPLSSNCNVSPPLMFPDLSFSFI